MCPNVFEIVVYIIRCADGSYYTGVTNNVERRFGEHSAGTDPKCYTFQRRPLALVYTARFRDVWEAIAWETHIKKWSRRKKEALIRGDGSALHHFSVCRNASHHRFMNEDRTCHGERRRTIDTNEA